MAIVALLTAIFALIVSIRSWRRLLATQALLARAEAAIDE
jgi:hypothetical protein